MASSSNSSLNIQQPSIPLFKGENYDFWCIKMKTLFLSQDIWDLVENGYLEPEASAPSSTAQEQQLKESKRNDAKALFFIQQGVSDSIFPRIKRATRAKEAWDILQQEFQGKWDIPLFRGENYDFWCIKMKTLFLSQGIWNLVENGYLEPEASATSSSAQEQQLKESKRNDAKALFFIQQGVSDSIFPRIMRASRAKEAWDILQQEFQGNIKYVAAPMEMTVDTSEERRKKKLLFGLSMEGDWGKVVEMYEKDPWAHTAKITRTGNTALHTAVSDGKEEIVEKLVNLISKNEVSKGNALKVVNDRNNTALHLAAWMGSVKMCESIAGVDSKLVGTRNVDGETPFFLAAVHGKKDAFLCLHSKCREPKEGYTYCRRKDGQTILHCAITGDYFELAYQIIFLYGDLVNYVNEEGITPLHLLASKPSAFKSGSHLSWWSKIIYHCIFVDELKQEELPKTSKAYDFPDCPENYHTCINFFFLVLRKMIKQLWGMIRGDCKKDGDAENPKTKQQRQQSTNGTQGHQPCPSNYDAMFGFFKVVSKAMLVILGLGSAEISKVQSKKQKHIWSVQIMNELLKRTSMYEYEDDGKNPQQTPPSQKADETTAYTAIPSELASPDDQKKEKKIEEKEEGEKKIPDRRKDTAILIAAKHGVAEMVGEILKLFPVAIHDMNSEKKNIVLLAVESRQPHVYQLLLEKTIFKESEFHRVDDKGNSALHLAAMQGAIRPWLIPGAALQMQWEIKWYEFVKNSMPPHFFVHQNKDGKTPKSVFTDTHKELVKNGGEWLTNTSQSCSVVAALIATVAFATSSTVPGGVNQNNGLPTLEAEPAFNVFAISSLVALCFSVTAVVMFLSILTSRYQERDFGHGLPRKLLVGLSSLFVSIASMLISFCAGHFFVLKDKLQYAAFPIYAATCLPVTFFAVAQFPLYFDLIWATFKKVPQRSYQVVSQ